MTIFVLKAGLGASCRIGSRVSVDFLREKGLSDVRISWHVEQGNLVAVEENSGPMEGRKVANPVKKGGRR